MKTSRRSTATIGTLLSVAAILNLVACSSLDTPGSSSSPSVVATPAATTSTPSASEPAASATASPSVTPAPGESAAPAAPAASGSTGGDTDACTFGELTGEIGQQNGAEPGTGSGMSQQQLAIILTNTGTAACTIQGWPGVSYVGDGDGTQLGRAATQDQNAPHPTVTLQPEASAQAPIVFTAVAVFDPDECRPAHADGVRVYPPGSTESMFLEGGGAGNGDACTTDTDDQMSVGAFVPNF